MSDDTFSVLLNYVEATGEKVRHPPRNISSLRTNMSLQANILYS